MENKKKILFVCHGNICRSPMAEFVMKDLVAKAGLSDSFHIESAAVSDEELGSLVYPPVRKLLAEHGISCEGKRARKFTDADCKNFDIIALMDNDNIRRLKNICGGVVPENVYLLKAFSGEPNGEVADPWYTGDFNATWRDVTDGCAGILEYFIK